MPESNERPATNAESRALVHWAQRLAKHRWRGLVWLQGEPEEATARAFALWSARSWRAPLWVSASRPPGRGEAYWLPAAKARTRLGSEHELVIFDACSQGSGFDPEAFGALSGTLRAGGLLVLITPPSWGACPDADYLRITEYPHRAESLPARYLKRLAGQLAESERVARWPAAGDLTLPELGRMSGADAAEREPAFDDADCATPDQAEAVSRLTRLRRRRPLVLTADRGRGKSAALGIAAARRLQGGERRLWVTAPRPAAVEPLFERLAALLPQGRREGNAFHVEADIDVRGEHAEVRFLAPDALIEVLHSGGGDSRSPPTLFVDEAAAIPTPLLARWLRAFPRIAFATTVHGYEGTGRGFAVRFRERLERDTPDWRELHLHQPVRWAAGDPLEALTRELLLLDAEPADDATVHRALGEDSLRLAFLDRAALAADEPALSELFGLLVQAHYRTTPADLRQLLDAPGVRLLAAHAGDRCVGVCLAQDEGGFPADLAAQIHTGQRRPRGHLLAQSLAAHGGQREAAEARWCRITRIAVHPAARRRGLGAVLIKRLCEQVAGEGIERLGVSFGAEVGLIDFWRAQGFVSLRLGLSREAASGEHALMMGRPLTAVGEPAIHAMNADFQRLLPGLLAFELAGLESELAATLLQEGEAPAISERTRSRLAWFAAGGGELALVRPWLAEAWLAWWRDPERSTADDELASLVAPLFQGERPAHGGAGRKARLAEWRALAERLYRHLA